MKNLDIAHFILTIVLLVVLSAMGYVIYQQQRLLNEVSLSLIGVQEIEWAKLTPCEERTLERIQSY